VNTLPTDLREYLKKMGVEAHFYQFEGHTMTVDAAVRRLSVNREKIIKSMLFIEGTGLPVLGIVTGDRKVSERKLATACGTTKVRRADPDEVKGLTGYDVGAVPPVGHKVRIRTFIDEKVMALDKVIGGGGEINVLLEINPIEIRRLSHGEVKDISE
jgi:Cys-tRNA(Pro) deacylase